MAIAGVASKILKPIIQKVTSPGVRQAVAKGGKVLQNPYVQIGGQGLVGAMAGGLPGALGGVVTGGIAGKYMPKNAGGAAATLGLSALGGLGTGQAAGALNRGVVQPITNTLTDLQREQGNTPLGTGIEKPEQIIENAGQGYRELSDAMLDMYQDPRYLAEARRIKQDTMQVNNQKGQIRGALNRDQYLANSIDRGMAETGATMRQLLQSQNAYVANF